MSNAGREQIIGDFVGLDYTKTQRKIAYMHQEFMKQPANIKAECKNDLNAWVNRLQKEQDDYIAEQEREAKVVAENNQITEKEKAAAETPQI